MYFARSVFILKDHLHCDYPSEILISVGSDTSMERFESDSGEWYSLAYLVGPPAESKYKPFESVEKAMEAIKKHGGWVKDKKNNVQLLVATVAKKLGCEWHTADTAIKASEKARRAMENETEITLDFVESKAFQRVNEGDGAMIRFILATKGRARGYGDAPPPESTTSEDNTLRIEIDDTTE